MRVFDLVRATNEQDDSTNPGSPSTSIMQTKSYLLAFILLHRCDLAILTDFLALRQREVPPPRVHVDLSADRQECGGFVSRAGAFEQSLQVVEGHVLWARYAALEIAFAAKLELAGDLLQQADYHLRIASATIEEYPEQTKSMLKEIEQARKLLGDEGKLEYEVCTQERSAMVAAMATEFSATGKWYSCVNGHPFTVEGNSSSKLESGCPDCGDTVLLPPDAYDESINGLAEADIGDKD